MTKEEAILHGALMALCLQLNGVGHITVTDSQLSLLKSASLIEMLVANAAAEKVNAAGGRAGKSLRLVTTEQAIALAYVRLHQPEFFTADELTDTCAAFDSLIPSTPNGHGILIDGYGNHSLITLNLAGEGAIDTLVNESNLGTFMAAVNKLAAEHFDEQQ